MDGQVSLAVDPIAAIPPSVLAAIAPATHPVPENNPTTEKNNEIAKSVQYLIGFIPLDWYEGKINGNGGFFPANHVRLLDENDQASAQSQPSNTNQVPELIAEQKEDVSKLDKDSAQKSATSIIESQPSESMMLNNEDHIEIVPAELIRKEGPISYKMKKEFGGLEPKKSHSWHSTWAIICVGYMVFYKDDPVKLKKKSSDKPILPVYVLKLETVNIKKEPKDGSRKNLISVQSRSGAILLLQPAAENELNEWYSCINDSTKENSTSAEHENGKTSERNILVMQKLFTKGPQPVGSSKEDKGDVRNDLNNMNIGMNINKKEKEVEIHPDELIFGGSLEKLAKSTNRNIPIVVERCISHVETHGGIKHDCLNLRSGKSRMEYAFVKGHVEKLIKQQVDQCQLSPIWNAILSNLALNAPLADSRIELSQILSIQGIFEGSPRSSRMEKTNSKMIIQLHGCNHQSLREILINAILTRSNLQKEFHVMLDFKVIGNVGLVVGSLNRWIKSFSKKKKDVQDGFTNNRFKDLATDMKSVILSSSPNVTFGVPNLLQQLSEMETNATYVFEFSDHTRNKSKSISGSTISNDQQVKPHGPASKDIVLDDAIAERLPSDTTKRSSMISILESVRSDSSISTESEVGLSGIHITTHTIQSFFWHQALTFTYGYTWDNASAHSCVPWSIQKIVYYNKEGQNQDESLEWFIRRKCTQSKSLCASNDCGRLMKDHFYHYIHNNTCITMKMNDCRVENSGDILMWVGCIVCNATTPKTIMSPLSGTYSFGKYLELLLYSNQFYPKSLCQHINRYSATRHFQYKDQTITFTNTLIQLYELNASHIRLFSNTGSASEVLDQLCVTSQHQFRKEIHDFYYAMRDYVDTMHQSLTSMMPEKDQNWIQNMLNDISKSLSEEVSILVEQVYKGPVTNKSRIIFCQHIALISNHITTWQREYLPYFLLKPKCVFPIHNNSRNDCHLIGTSGIIIWENDPSSIIASCLSFPLFIDFVKDGSGTKSVSEIRKGKVFLSCITYFAKQFLELQEICGIRDLFVHSLQKSSRWDVSGGKSKAKFFKTHDDAFVLKGLSTKWTQSELESLQSFSPKYFKYIFSGDKKPSIFAKMFGFYRITINTPIHRTEVVDFMAMEHLFKGLQITRKFDLKGLVHRHMNPNASGSVLWDGDWLEGMKDFNKLFLGRYPSLFKLYPHSKLILKQSIRNDCEFLASANIMDYSLLVGIDDLQNKLFIGIVDYLSPYNFAKRIEHSGKLLLSKDVTVVPPEEYAARIIILAVNKFHFVKCQVFPFIGMVVDQTELYEYDELTIQHDPVGNLKAGTGATVWDSSLVLLKYLELQIESDTNRIFSKPNLNILELGSGTGLVGIVLAKRLPNARFTLTDKDTVLPLLKYNVSQAKLPNIQTLKLDWEDENDRNRFTKLRLDIDIILLSDCITWPNLYQPLLDTINCTSNKNTMLIFSHESRNFEKECKFYAGLNQTFTFNDIKPKDMHPDYQSEDIFLFEAHKK
ncbi:hypothetical protein HDV02_004868 [Globomyces sp. JEL0801]|nr:hypothetical protein HDV02_004868 [Globomyces sp. JEL0801]